jgi:hypothetical protein
VSLSPSLTAALRALQCKGRSEAIRRALLEAGEGRSRSASLRVEALALVEDEADRAEKAEITALMDWLRDPW